MIALYARVSTRDKGQENEVQARRLRPAGEERKQAPGEAVRLFEDEASATDLRGRRAWRELIEARPRVVIVVRLDRAFRSVADAVTTLDLFRQRSIDFVCLDQPVDTTNPAGRLFLNMLAAFAEFERDVISERVRDGLARAAEKGRRPGRPRGSRDSYQRVRHGR